MEQRMKVGFIGLGIMGKPMALNLMKEGDLDLYVWNRSQPAIDVLTAQGAVSATKEEIGTVCDVIITMLPGRVTPAAGSVKVRFAQG